MSEISRFETQVRVLKYLVENGGDYGYADFSMITGATGLDKKQVRTACRSLSRCGMAKYGKGLSDEDGRFWGSGYACTDAAMKLLG